MRLRKPEILIRGHPQLSGHLLGVCPRLHGGGQHHHVRLDLHGLPQQRVRPLHHQVAVQRVDPGDPAAHIGGVVPLHDPLHELLVALAVRPDVHVEDVGLGVGHLLFQEQGVLGRVHAADLGAVRVTVHRVPRPHAGDEDHRLGLPPVGRPEDLPTRRPRGVHQPLELQAGDDVRELPPAVLPQLRLIPGVESRGHHDGPEGLGEDLVLLLELDGPRRAELLADPAAPLLDVVGAVLPVDDRHVRHRLRKGHIDGLPLAQPGLEFGRHFDRALLVADPAAGALLHVHAAGAPPDLDLEVADEAGDLLDLRVGEDADAGIGAALDHLGREDAGGAIQRGEGLVVLGHPAPDGGGALDQGHLVAGLRDVQSRLDPGDPPAHHQGLLGNRNLGLRERLVAADPGGRHPGEVDGLGGGRVAVGVHPGTVLPDVGHLRHERIEARLRDALSERRLVQARGAGGHHDPIQAVLGDGLAYQDLPRLRAHILIVARVRDAGHRRCLGCHPLHIYRLRDIGSAPTDEHARSRHIVTLTSSAYDNFKLTTDSAKPATDN